MIQPQQVELSSIKASADTILVFDTLNIGTYSSLWTQQLISHNIAKYFKIQFSIKVCFREAYFLKLLYKGWDFYMESNKITTFKIAPKN